MKHIEEGFILYKKESWEATCGYMFKRWENPENGYTTVKPHTIEFEVPDDFDPRPAQIKALEKKQQEAAAAFHALTVEIKRQIQELQALEMTA